LTSPEKAWPIAEDCILFFIGMKVHWLIRSQLVLLNDHINAVIKFSLSSPRFSPYRLVSVSFKTWVSNNSCHHHTNSYICACFLMSLESLKSEITYIWRSTENPFQFCVIIVIQFCEKQLHHIISFDHWPHASIRSKLRIIGFLFASVPPARGGPQSNKQF